MRPPFLLSKKYNVKWRNFLLHYKWFNCLAWSGVPFVIFVVKYFVHYQSTTAWLNELCFLWQVGEGEKLVRALFAVARELQPSIIFIGKQSKSPRQILPICSIWVCPTPKGMVLAGLGGNRVSILVSLVLNIVSKFWSGVKSRENCRL